MLNKFRRIISGKRRKDPAGREMMTVFQNKYADFKNLLESNAELLKIISGIEERLGGHHVFGMSYIRSEMSRLVFHSFRMVKSFEGLAGRRYPELIDTLDRIQAQINEALDLRNAPRMIDYVLPYTRITREMVDFVGGKNANLGEIRSRIGLPVPRGFAITTTAGDELIEFNDLLDEIRRLKMELNAKDPENILRISGEIQRMFPAAMVPAAVEKAIFDAFDREIGNSGEKRVALRSSAVGEDTDLSFAGQYVSCLNISRDEIIGRYKDVVASLFTPRAISYRLHMGIPFEDVAMSVACVEMVDARAGGVMYTRHPFEPERDHIIINGVWGLGKKVVDGDVTPDEFEMTKTEPPVMIGSLIVSKPHQLVPGGSGELAEAPVAEEDRDAPCLTADQATVLARYGMKLEGHFQLPQDIEWALDREGNIILLQSRPLKLEGEPAPEIIKRCEGFEVILEGGSIASPGIGYGAAHIIHSEEDLLTFPDGGVLVAAHPSPQYVIVMEKAKAIVTNSGSITGHMASLAREFKVPALLNTKTATIDILQGLEITVDAFSGRVYAGKVSELLDMDRKQCAFMKDTPVYRTLENLARLIIPLNLTNPKSRRFSPKNCRTVHDVMRFAHERSYGEIFNLSDATSDQGKISVKLAAPIPVDLYVIDLGGGLAMEGKLSKVRPDQVVSAPFKALLDGMLHADLKPFEPRPVNLRGFLSVMSEQMLSPPNPVVERFGDRSYAIISDKYLNFSSRVGYHYSILDSYCGQTAMKNYINFQFSGGAADNVRRNRRARLIQKVLEANGFLVEVQGDRVNARLGKQELAVVAEKLDTLGRLLIFTRQMDMLMNHEGSVSDLAGRFLRGKYDLGNDGR